MKIISAQENYLKPRCLVVMFTQTEILCGSQRNNMQVRPFVIEDEDDDLTF